MVNFKDMRRAITIITLIVLTFCAVPSAHSFWVWSPKSGKWSNPKYAVKPTPKEQLVYAKTVYSNKDYKNAREEFKRLIQYFPKSVEAAEGQFYLGLCDEAEDNYYQAYLDYQKMIEKYPFSERIQEAIEKEYKLAEEFMAGKKRKTMGVALPVENPAIEIYKKVVDNSPFGPLAASAQYKLGLVLKGAGRYFEAEDEFNKVITTYPDSEWVSAAKFQIASCKASLSRSPDYDQESTREAKSKFEEFVKEHPDAELSKEAIENLKGLEEKEAQSSYEIGRFYEKRKIYGSAKIYYDAVIEKFPQSLWAEKCLERLRFMESHKK
ncbi:MAG: outer membrane protein assembly factor BamD [Candidatus Omnitrophica bacterium]|nr:outer membrane protein assembly factor BamD [Candidatus Omnitrophota bacterium]